MAPSSIQHRRTHNLLLISKLLNQRDTASPFTLVLDSLEQSAKPLIAEQVKRANAAKVLVIFVSFETIKRPQAVGHFVEAWKQTPQAWQKELNSIVKSAQSQRKLLIFDNINALNASVNVNLPGLLSSFITPTTSLIAVYHVDTSPTSNDAKAVNAYSPSSITLLRYLATTIITVHSLHHILAAKAARDRSHVEPSHGLEEGLEGIVQGMGANNTDGVVLELEYRRRSGRGVRAWYVLPLGTSKLGFGIPDSGISKEQIFLLDDHSAYRDSDESLDNGSSNDDPTNVTFELGLTQKQRADREGVVLPYFDAQKGGGDGGRILYDMGEDDDFDEEEDEI